MVINSFPEKTLLMTFFVHRYKTPQGNTHLYCTIPTMPSDTARGTRRVSRPARRPWGRTYFRGWLLRPRTAAKQGAFGRNGIGLWRVPGKARLPVVRHVSPALLGSREARQGAAGRGSARWMKSRSRTRVLRLAPHRVGLPRLMPTSQPPRHARRRRTVTRRRTWCRVWIHRQAAGLAPIVTLDTREDCTACDGTDDAPNSKCH